MFDMGIFLRNILKNCDISKEDLVELVFYLTSKGYVVSPSFFEGGKDISTYDKYDSIAIPLEKNHQNVGKLFISKNDKKVDDIRVYEYFEDTIFKKNIICFYGDYKGERIDFLDIYGKEGIIRSYCEFRVSEYYNRESLNFLNLFHDPFKSIPEYVLPDEVFKASSGTIYERLEQIDKYAREKRGEKEIVVDDKPKSL